LRWWTRDHEQKLRKLIIELGFEALVLLNWIVTVIVLIALNATLETPSDTLGKASLYCSYVLNVLVAGIA
jgi:hypothetical protein